jgi:hypothetical protein
VGYFDGIKPPPPPTEGAAAPNLTIVTTTNGTSSYAAAALRSEANEVAGAAAGHRNDALNKAWFRMGRHVGAGSIDPNTVRLALTEAAMACGLPQHEIDTVLRDDPTSGLAQGAANPRHPAPLPDLPALTVIEAPDLEPSEEETFWGTRDVLRHLHDFARARRVSPWAVLGVALARIIAATPHQVCLPPIVGGKASLNLFVGLVGPSGSGKGAAEAVAADALQTRYITCHNVGSGEGIAHGYMHRSKGALEWNDDEHAVLFSVPEIDSLAAQGDRKGATLMPQLRSGWTGEQLGFGYADPTKRIIIPGHQYRLCLVAGIQPARAACLLDDADGGTPQRFLWMPATDPHAPDEPPTEPPPITWAAPAVSDIVGIGGVYIDVCYLARDTIRSNRLARLRGEGEALDGHALLAQLKTAAALGIVDGRYSVTDDDWRLAGVIAKKSAAVRAGVADTLRAKIHEANHGKAEAEAKRAVVVAETLADAGVKRVCGVVMRKLRREGDWVVGSDLKKAIAGRDRTLFEDAVERLLEAGQIEVDEVGRGTKYKAKGEPA